MCLLRKHSFKNFENYIVSNFVFFTKINFFKSPVKCSFFYNSYNFYLSIFILFNFWTIHFKKLHITNHKISLVLNLLDFFYIFSIFFYPFLFNLNFFEKKSSSKLCFTFFINRFFLNPLLTYFYSLYNFNIKKTWILFRIYISLKKKDIFYLNFYLNFFQIPLFLK